MKIYETRPGQLMFMHNLIGDWDWIPKGYLMECKLLAEIIAGRSMANVRR